MPRAARASATWSVAYNGWLLHSMHCAGFSVKNLHDAKVWATVSEDLRPPVLEELEKAFLSAHIPAQLPCSHHVRFPVVQREAPPVQPDAQLPGIEPGDMLYDYFFDQACTCISSALGTTDDPQEVTSENFGVVLHLATAGKEGVRTLDDHYPQVRGLPQLQSTILFWDGMAALLRALLLLLC